MADLNVNKTDTTHLWEDAGQNLIPNPDFESAPTFTAATNVNQRWIDGTASGSTTDDSHFWAIITKGGTVEASFNTAEFHGGATSMKLSLTATGSFIDIRLANTSTVANINRYYIPVLSSTSYICKGWMKTNYVSGDSSDGALIAILEYGSAATTLLASRNGTKVKTTTGWTQYTIQFTTTSTTAFVTPALQITGNSGTATLIMDAWFDDLQLQAVSPNGPQVTVSPIVTPGIQDISGPKIWS